MNVNLTFFSGGLAVCCWDRTSKDIGNGRIRTSAFQRGSKLWNWFGSLEVTTCWISIQNPRKSEIDVQNSSNAGFGFENHRKSRDFSILLVTSTDSNSELRKDFLDRKKVLKSLDANSFISRGNVGVPARCWLISWKNNKISEKSSNLYIFDTCS